MQVSEESDEETWQEGLRISHSDIWKELCDEFDAKRAKILEYKKSKLSDCEDVISPTVKYMDDQVFVILKGILENALFKAKETNSLKYQKTPYNAIDFIAENLWNLNPNYPERQEKWTELFDMEWVKRSLESRPRPHFPFSWIWSKEYAALKIQSFMKGYWVRRREDVQEVRQFWRNLLEEKRELESQPKMMDCECGGESVIQDCNLE